MSLPKPKHLSLSATRVYIAQNMGDDVSPADYEVIISLFGALFGGDLLAQGDYDDGSGNKDHKEVPVEIWKQCTEAEFEDCMYNPRYPVWVDMAKQSGPFYENITLERASIDTWLLPSLKNKATTGVSAQIKDAGGRPPKYNWADFDKEMLKVATHPDGFDSVGGKTGLVKHMEQWCADKWAEQPSGSQIRDYVAKRYPS